MYLIHTSSGQDVKHGERHYDKHKRQDGIRFRNGSTRKLNHPARLQADYALRNDTPKARGNSLQSRIDQVYRTSEPSNFVRL